MTADNPMNIKISAKASANFDSLIKVIPKGLSRLFSLVFAKREANNARYTALMAAKTQIEYQKILESKYDFENNRLVSPQNTVSSTSLNPLQIEEAQEIVNLAGNIRMAAEALKDIPDDKISDREVDNDFFSRWRREAKIIGNAELQRLWGRLLAEEIKDPESVSFRVLDILKNVSSSEARLFQKIAPYICDSDFIVCDFANNNLPKGFSFDDYLLLAECGLTLNIDNSVYWFSTDTIMISGKEYTEIVFNNIIFAVDIDKKEVTIPGAALTTSGKTAIRICDYDTPSIDMIKYFCETIQKQPSNPINRILCYNKNDSSIYDQEIPIYDSKQGMS